MYYLNYFFICSILGFLFEHIVYFILGIKNGDSGIFFGPYTPVYGIGIIMIIIISNFIFKNLHTTKFLQICVIFITVTVLLTVIELLGGILIEKIFHITFWDYSNLKFHLGKYIALEISLVWGIASLFVIYILKPFIDKYIHYIPNWLTIILIMLFCLDIMATLIWKTKLKSYCLHRLQ